VPPTILATDTQGVTTDRAIAYGTRIIGESLPSTITLSNTGGVNLVIGSIGGVNGLAAPFSIMTDNCSAATLAPAGTCTIVVDYSPVTAAVSSDSFDIPSNDPNNSSIAIALSGTSVVQQTIVATDTQGTTTDRAIAYGTVTTDTSVTSTITLSNTGGANLVIGSIGGINSLAAPFSITADTS
jgi:hypothetical protein